MEEGDKQYVRGKDASKALSSYRQRNEVEVLFDDFKNSLTGDRTRSHNDSALFGRLFILFIAVITAVRLRMMVNAIPEDVLSLFA